VESTSKTVAIIQIRNWTLKNSGLGLSKEISGINLQIPSKQAKQKNKKVGT
jgi:hypothetical protein